MMGKQKYLLRVTSLFKESPVVNFSSIERIVKNKKKGFYEVKKDCLFTVW